MSLLKKISFRKIMIRIKIFMKTFFLIKKIKKKIFKFLKLKFLKNCKKIPNKIKCNKKSNRKLNRLN